MMNIFFEVTRLFILQSRKKKSWARSRSTEAIHVVHILVSWCLHNSYSVPWDTFSRVAQCSIRNTSHNSTLNVKLQQQHRCSTVEPHPWSELALDAVHLLGVRQRCHPSASTHCQKHACADCVVALHAKSVPISSRQASLRTPSRACERSTCS